MLKWELIADNTYRLKVYGGWVIEKYYESNGNCAVGTSSVFISDPDHVWTIER